jgi:hypothetical protein
MSESMSFVAHLRPVLPGGDYSITAAQTISLDTAAYQTTRTFTVAAERFALPPTAIRSVFPPEGALGDFSAVLPHVILDRPTLPWERSPEPWLAVLVFSGAEQPAPTTVTLADLGVPLERHETATDPVTVIDVPRALADDLLPPLRDLPLLAHVRRTEDDAAVVLASRLPQPGVSSTAHLVSLEGRYGKSGPLPGGDTVRLVSLASWRFASVEAQRSFPYLARALRDEGAPFRLPDSGEPLADAYLRQGYVPAPHALRQGGTTLSWYRGPFVTGPSPSPEAVAPRTSDALLRFYSDVGMLDTGYAAAWQLGRLLALQNTAAANAMYAWKRRRAQSAKRTTGDVPLAVAPIDTSPPAAALGLLSDLATLTGVPARYLVPDERLLPSETVRFLRIDPYWISCLVDGAYSIGRLTRWDAEQDRAHPPLPAQPVLTGALIRSELVSGYPDLVVAGYDTAGPLAVARHSLLSPSVLLVLFEGELTRLDLEQNPASLHFGVELPADGQYAKTLRDGRQAGPFPLGRRGTISPAEIATDPADFALQMIETAESVTFLSAH